MAEVKLPASLTIPLPPRFQDFEPISKLIAPDPPVWLTEELMRWSSSILLDRAVHMKQPTRAQVVRRLKAIHDAAALLRRELGEQAMVEFLNAGDDQSMDMPAKFSLVIGEILVRADRAVKLPSLVDENGKPRAGRGPALLDGAISAQAFCALFIAEAWRAIRGEYPASRNRDATQAADIYWQQSGGKEQKGWGDDPLSAWRYHFKVARAVATEDPLRLEIQRHLATAEHMFKQLQPEVPEKTANNTPG